jgi:molybdenum cofactor cytidylyltransferase
MVESSPHRLLVCQDGRVPPPPPPSTLRTAAVVLAAGEGSRFIGATHKLLAPLNGQSLVLWAVGAAVEAAIGPTIVVAGAVDLVGPLTEAGLIDQVSLVANDRWRQGQATSLAAGIAAADAAGVDAVVVGLGDQPGIPAAAWRLVAGADPSGAIVVATYGGCRRNPVRLARTVWPDLPGRGDEGARSFIARRPELVIEVGCPGRPADINTLEDLARWS